MIRWYDNNNNNNNNYAIRLPQAQGYYDDDDRPTDEGMHRIKPSQYFFCLFPISDYYGGYFIPTNYQQLLLYLRLYILTGSLDDNMVSLLLREDSFCIITITNTAIEQGRLCYCFWSFLIQEGLSTRHVVFSVGYVLGPFDIVFDQIHTLIHKIYLILEPGG